MLLTVIMLKNNNAFMCDNRVDIVVGKIKFYQEIREDRTQISERRKIYDSKNYSVGVHRLTQFTWVGIVVDKIEVNNFEIVLPLPLTTLNSFCLSHG